MGYGNILGLALAGAVSYHVVKKSGVGKELQNLMKDFEGKGKKRKGIW